MIFPLKNTGLNKISEAFISSIPKITGISIGNYVMVAGVIEKRQT